MAQHLHVLFTSQRTWVWFLAPTITTNSSSRSSHSSGLCGHLHSHAHIHKKTHNFKNNKNESLKIGIIEQISYRARLTPKICTHSTNYSSLPHHQSWLRSCVWSWDAYVMPYADRQQSASFTSSPHFQSSRWPKRSFSASGIRLTCHLHRGCWALESGISTGLLFSQHSPSPVHS